MYLYIHIYTYTYIYILLMICWTPCICMDLLLVAANKFLFVNIGRENVISYHISTWQLNLGLRCCSYVRSGFQSPQRLQRVLCRMRTESDCDRKLYMSLQYLSMSTCSRYFALCIISAACDAQHTAHYICSCASKNKRSNCSKCMPSLND